MSDARSTYQHDKMCDATVKAWARRADGSWECLECRHIQAIRVDERNNRKIRDDLLGLLESAWIHGLEAMDPLDPHTYKVLRNALTGDTHA